MIYFAAWADGLRDLIAEGYYVVGFDNVRHVYGDQQYPGQLVIQDVLTLHGRQFKDAALIVASPPCQGYSYRAMPWKRAKALPPPDNSLFEACFRIQREACAAAGRRIPLVVENVRGAQRWVGRARWNYGSYYLWGDVPALMPMTFNAAKRPGHDWNRFRQSGEVSPHWRLDGMDSRKNSGGSWFAIGSPGQKITRQNPDGRNDPRDDVKVIAHLNRRNGHRSTSHLTNPAEHIKCGGDWFGPGNPSAMRNYWSGSTKRKAASAMIAKIPFQLARHIARVYR